MTLGAASRCINFRTSGQNRTLSEGYSLGMVKLEAFDDPHFMHQTVRGGHTDHTGSIVSLMACIFDLKKKFLCNWTVARSFFDLDDLDDQANSTVFTVHL